MPGSASEICEMTEECPGYDRRNRVCLVLPDDCELVAAWLASRRPVMQAVPVMPPRPSHPCRDA